MSALTTPPASVQRELSPVDRALVQALVNAIVRELKAEMVQASEAA